MLYDGPVSLVACPFCGEMFVEGEAEACPVCAVALERIEKLPRYASRKKPADANDPDDERLAVFDLRGGKGAVAGMAIVGVVLFFLPWVHLTLPYVDDKSGFDLARHRLGWLWAVFVAWLVVVPTVLSRGSLRQLRGARVACGFLCAIPLVATAMLLARPPHATVVPVRFSWCWAIFATSGTSLGAVIASLRLGVGRRAGEAPPTITPTDLATGRSASEPKTLH